MPLREFFKSKKRKANEAEIKSAVKKGEGTVKVTARRVDNPKPTGKRLIKRGGEVSVKQRTVNMGTRTVKDPDKVEKWEERTKQDPIFENEDRSNKDGSVTKRTTTVELGKSLKERPEKTQRRIKAQSLKQTSYDAGGGKMEHSGSLTPRPDIVTPHEKITPQSHKEKVTKQVTDIGVKQPDKQKLITIRTNRESDKQNKLKTTVMLNRKVKKVDPKTGEKKKVNKPTKIFSISRNTKTRGSKSKKGRE